MHRTLLERFSEQILAFLFTVELFTITQNAVFQDNKYDGLRWNPHVVIYAFELLDWFWFWPQHKCISLLEISKYELEELLTFVTA